MAGRRTAVRADIAATVLVVCALLAAVGVVYYRAFEWCYYEWTVKSSYYAHAVFVPFFVAAIIWRDWPRLRREPIGRCWWGLLPMALGGLFTLHGYRADITASISLGFVFFAAGGLLVATGWRFTKAIAVPAILVLSVIPVIPNSAMAQITFPVQLVSTMMAATVLNLTGFHAMRTGTQIRMDTYFMNVEEACSGVRTMLGLLVFAAAFAQLLDAPRWKRWTVFLSAIPLSLVVNGVRIMLIGLAGELISSEAASSFHDYSGFIVLIVGFMFLFSMARWLRCERFMNIPLQDGAGAPKPQTREERDALAQEAYGPPRAESLRALWPGLVPVAAVGLLFVGLRAVGASQVVRPVPPMQAAEVPSRTIDGRWQQLGEDNPIEPDVQAVLMPDTWVDRIYAAQPPATGSIHLLITGGSGRRTFHDPHDCFGGGGWQFRDTRPVTVQTAVGPVTLQEAEATNTRDGRRELLMFLFVVDGKTYLNMMRVHGAIFRQTFIGSRGMPFYFVRFRQLRNGFTPERRAEMREFIAGLWPTIAPKVLGPPDRK